MIDHPNAQDRLHARTAMTTELPEGVAEEYWTAFAPVQADQFGPAGRIPLRLARLAWDAYAAAGHGQSLETLNQRSGLSWGELIMLLRGPAHYRGQHWRDCFKECGKAKDL